MKRSRLSLIVVLLLGLMAFSEAKPANVCVFQTTSWYSISDLLQCFYSVPYDSRVAATTLQTLRTSAQLYAFLDIANQSPDPNLPLQVDLLGQLDKIGASYYKYDYDFHSNLRDLYDQLNDAHTQYYAPLCYNNFLVRQAFAPISYMDSSLPAGKQQIIAVSTYFPTDLIDFYHRTSGINITQFAGARIVSIDGVEAVSYFEQYANTSLGMCKDAGTRFNQAMTQPEPLPTEVQVTFGYWQQRTHRNPLPTSSSTRYVLQQSGVASPIVLSLPWSVLPLANYTGIDSFMADYWAPPPPPPPSNSKTQRNVQKVISTTLLDERDEKLRRLSSKDNTLTAVSIPSSSFSSSSSSQTFTPLANGTDISFYELNDNRTMVMYIDSFGPSSTVSFYRALNQGFSEGGSRKLDRLIIDLTNNGGGSICLGQSVIAFLQESMGYPNNPQQNQNWGPQDIPLSDLAGEMIAQAVKYNISNTPWSPGFYDNQQGQHISNDDPSYLWPGVPHERGGHLRNYSKLVHIDNCGRLGYEITPKDAFNASQIIILTHGFCGSMCSYVANHLALYDKVVTVVAGGLEYRQAMQYTSFPGGQVMDSGSIYSTLQDLHFNTTCCEADPLVPRELLTSGSYRYCVREIYPNIPDYNTPPMEFSFQQADYHLYLTEQQANYPYYLWYQVLPFFSS